MVEDYIFRAYQEGDEKGIVDLLKIVFPEWASKSDAVEYWKWKYTSSSLGSLVAVAIHNGQIIGVSHDLSLKLKLGEIEYSCMYGDDAATHPNYQGKGVYGRLNKLNDASQDKMGVKITYSVPTHPAFARTQHSFSMFLPQPIITLLTVNNPRSYIKAKKFGNPKLAEFGLSLLQIISRFRRLSFKLTHKNAEVKILDFKIFDESVDRLWRDISFDLKFGIVRNSEYLKWRYSDSRAGRYIIRRALEGDMLVGLSVTEIKGEINNAEGYIMEILIMPNRLDVAYQLVSDILISMESVGVNAIHYLALKRYPILDVLNKFGFVSIPFQTDLVLKLNMKGVPSSTFDLVKNLQPKSVIFTYGDYFY